MSARLPAQSLADNHDVRGRMAHPAFYPGAEFLIIEAIDERNLCSLAISAGMSAD